MNKPINVLSEEELNDSLNNENQRICDGQVIYLETQFFHKLLSKLGPKNVPVDKIIETINNGFKDIIKEMVKTKIRKYLYASAEHCQYVHNIIKLLLEIQYRNVMEEYEVTVDAQDSIFDYGQLTFNN